MELIGDNKGSCLVRGGVDKLCLNWFERENRRKEKDSRMKYNSFEHFAIKRSRKLRR